MTVHRKNASHTLSTLNDEILKKYLIKKNDDGVRKTHLFEGRYENIYLTAKHIPELTTFLEEALSIAKSILKNKNLRAAYWFNDMPPGSSTLVHSHDDYDELLSGVYYISVPENSGNLIIHESSGKKIEIEPKAGQFIFFKPDIRHEVTENKNTKHRLSIGINFGKKQ